MNDTPAEENSYNSNTSVTYLKLKGRSGKKSSKINNPPKDQAWIWLTSELISSLAWRSMSINCQKLVNRLIIEHRNNGGYENGHLICTYKDFVDYGLTRNNIRPAIEEAQALGLVKHQRGERVFAKNQPNFKDGPIDTKAKEGDLITFDYNATIDEKTFKGGEGKNTQLELGKDLFIKI